MTVRLIIPGLLGLAVLLLAGCGSTPPPSFEPTPKAPVSPAALAAPATSAAPALAELAGTNCAFREVIVSVPVEGAHQVYQNLHVQLVATVNPLNASVYDASSVRGMLNRLGPRTCAEVAKLLSESPTISPHKLDQVHDAIITKIQPAIRQTLRDWPHASQYDVDVVIVSMYWTDSSVGRHDLGPW